MPPLIFFKKAEVIDSSRDGRGGEQLCSSRDGRKPPTNTCLLPYTGVGSGLTRVRELDDEIELLNDENRQEVIVTFWRKGNQEKGKVTKKSNQEDMRAGKVKDILNFCTVPRTAKEIMERLGISNQSKNRKIHIASLVEQGLLKMTIPDKPNDRNQKYVKA